MMPNPLLLFAVIVIAYLVGSIKILAEYERGVIFRLGKLLPEPKGPGVILVFAPIDRMVRTSLRIETLECATGALEERNTRITVWQRSLHQRLPKKAK